LQRGLNSCYGWEEETHLKGYDMSDGHLRVDPAQNFMERYPQPLDPLFHPFTVAVIGAKDNPGSVGRTVMVNLLTGGLKGKIYPINPKRSEVLGVKAYPSILDVPEPVDLAVIITPATTVPGIIAECVQAHVKTAIIISAGFKELGEKGLELEKEILAEAKKGSLSIIGPNCLGVMNPIYGLNATFARGMALPGNLAFISQSGAMCTAVLDWSLQEKIGFSAFVSIGSMADVGWGALIDYLGSDPHTDSLLLYMETIGNARSFMTAAREAALEKPIIVIKAGRSQAAAKAAASHTGSLAGSDEVFDAALERIGVLRVDTIAELFSMASVLSRQPRPKGPRLSIVTNAGGPAVLATDATVLNHAELTPLKESIVKEFDTFLPEAWSHSNPIDILGDANAERYGKAVELALQDENSHGLLVILSPQDMTDSTGIAKELAPLVASPSKPILASWMGGETVQEGASLLSQAKIPVFNYPDDAAKTFAMMWRYSQNLQSLYETPEAGREDPYEHHLLVREHEQIKAIFDQAKREGRTLLTEFESKKVLAIYQIPTVETYVAKNQSEAAALAEQVGFPVVLKLYSQTITHKTDVGGVKLNLRNQQEVEKAFQEIKDNLAACGKSEYFEGVTVQRMIKSGGYELILGSSTDPQFGSVLLFGMGGQLVEVFKDRALAIPPLNRNLAHQLMEKTKIYTALQGVRGRKPVDMDFLEELLVRFSLLIVEHRRIKECDINPLLASDEGIIAVDARLVLHDWSIPDHELPQLAIRPYPRYYIRPFKLKDDTLVVLRPIRPEDEPKLVQFHRELSEKSVRQRYLAFLSLDERVAHERLVRICFNDYDREWALVAEIQNGPIIGISRLTRIPGTHFAQIRMIIADAYHNLGLGTQLVRQSIEIAKQEKIEVIYSTIFTENQAMIKVFEKLGFMIYRDENDPLLVQAKWSEGVANAAK
jgi:acetyltransferase